jgi:hypothetical protein
MNMYPIRRTFLLLFGLAVVSAGCQEGANPKTKTPQASPPSIGREYGETLRGAINKAHSAKDTLEASSRALEEAENIGK